MIKNFVGFSAIALFVISCTNVKGPIPEAAQTNDCDTANWYSGKIEPIINTNCAISGCHDASSGMDMSTYDALKVYVDNGMLKDRALIKKNMPISPVNPLSASQLNRINCWLEKGAQKTSTGGTTGTTTTCTTTIYYSSTIAPLITTNCAVLGCHDAGSGNGDYTTITDLQADALNGKLKNRVVVVMDMPEFPVKPLSAIDVNKINCWIQQGALNN
jgi:ribosomal protein S16